MTNRLSLLVAVVLPLTAQTPVGEPILNAIREGNHAEVAKLIAGGVSAHVQLPNGMPTLLYAVITSDANMLKLLLEKGADVNAQTSFGITALHAAVYDLEKTRVLLAAKANPNATAANGITPLMGAVSRGGALTITKALVQAGAEAKNTPTKSNPNFGPLRFALPIADLDTLKYLIDQGADPKSERPLTRFSSQRTSPDCLRLVLERGAPANTAVLANAAGTASLERVKLLVEHGVSVNGQDDRGYTPLMRAAMSYSRNKEVIEYLLSKGADTTPKNENGATALSIAERYGDTTVVAVLKAANAPSSPKPVIPEPVRGNTVKAAIEHGVALIEKIGPPVFKQRGCVSCHNNTQPAMVVATARRRGFAVDEALAKRELAAIAADDRARFARLMAGLDLPEISAYILLALDTVGQAPDLRTDLSYHQLAFSQHPDGHWFVGDYRPPQEYSNIAATGLAIRGLQAYAPPGRAVEARERVERASKWLAAARPYGVEEQAMRLLGLGWSKAETNVIAQAKKDLVADQLSNGGWPQLPGMEADAYATGLALYALHIATGFPVTQKTYQRGVQYLLDTQRPDGSWFVESRSYPFQPYFESGFPYGHNQWISSAASSWALLSLLFTVP
jgi:ankyrin repeat protein